MCVIREIKKGTHKYKCDITGKPITVFNEFGSYCDSLCGYEAQIFATTRASNMIDDMGPIFEQLKVKD